MQRMPQMTEGEISDAITQVHQLMQREIIDGSNIHLTNNVRMNLEVMRACLLDRDYGAPARKLYVVEQLLNTNFIPENETVHTLRYQRTMLHYLLPKLPDPYQTLMPREQKRADNELKLARGENPWAKRTTRKPNVLTTSMAR